MSNSGLLTRTTDLNPCGVVACSFTCCVYVTELNGVAVTHIREVFDSNLNRDADYPDSGVPSFFSAPPGKFRVSTAINPQPIPFRSVPTFQSFMNLLLDTTNFLVQLRDGHSSIRWNDLSHFFKHLLLLFI
jgi:hypothetical protein